MYIIIPASNALIYRTSELEHVEHVDTWPKANNHCTKSSKLSSLTRTANALPPCQMWWWWWWAMGMGLHDTFLNSACLCSVHAFCRLCCQNSYGV